MKVLIVKTSSLGDVIHTLPAVTDAAETIRDIGFDWVVEEGFAEVPTWHSAVDRVIPVALRRWRKGWWSAWRGGEVAAFRNLLGSTHYDLIIDAQGLIKSGLITLMARGERSGLDRGSAREPMVAYCYQRQIHVPREQHAIARVRMLFAKALGYKVPSSEPDYGISYTPLSSDQPPYLIFLHGTTWSSKLWPEPYWGELVQKALAAGYQVRLPWGSGEERERAERIIANAGGGTLLPRMGLPELKSELAAAAGVVGVDSGLAHLAAALDLPAVTLYGPTRTELTGAMGERQINLRAEFPCAPCVRRVCDYQNGADVAPACFSSLPPQLVWERLQQQMGVDG